MRTNIVIDDDLMAEAMKAAGAKTKRETVNKGLRLLVQLRQQEKIRAARGKLPWEGELDKMRRNW